MESCNQGKDFEYEPSPKNKKSWSELRGVVSEFRRKLSGVSDGSVPDHITFRSLPDGR